MGLFDRNIQTGPNAQQLGFAAPTAPANSFTPPGLPVGYGQMQGQPLLSRNPNYGVPTGIAALLGGQNPMGAPQAGAFLTPQQAAPNPMEGINPVTGQPFQTFDAGVVTDALTQGRQAEEQRQRDMLVAARERAAAEAAAAEAAAQAERDRIAAEQAAAAKAEADRIAAEQAAADAAAQAERDRIAAEAAAEAQAKAEADRLAAEEAARQEAARERAEAARERAEAARGEGQMFSRPAMPPVNVRPSTGMGGEKGGGIGQVMMSQPAATTIQPAPVRPTPTPRPVPLRPTPTPRPVPLRPTPTPRPVMDRQPQPDIGMDQYGMQSFKIDPDVLSRGTVYRPPVGSLPPEPLIDELPNRANNMANMGGIGGMADPAVMEQVRRQIATIQPPPPPIQPPPPPIQPPPPPVATPKPAKSVGRGKGRRKPAPPKQPPPPPAPTPKPVARKKPASKADIRGEKTNTLRRTIMPVPPKPNTETVKKKRKAPTKSRGRRGRGRGRGR